MSAITKMVEGGEQQNKPSTGEKRISAIASMVEQGSSQPAGWAGFKAPEYVPPPSTLGKVAGFLAPTITKTVGKIKKGEDVTARDIGGSALEAASYLIPGGAIAKGVGLGIKAGTIASKIAVPAAVGGVSGASFGAGQAVADGEGIGGVAKEALKTGAIGTTFGGALGAAGAGFAAKKLRGKTSEQFLGEATQRANLGPIPETGKPTPLALPAPRTAAETPIELPAPGILKSQGKIAQPVTVDEANNLRVFGTKERPTEKAGKIVPQKVETPPVSAGVPPSVASTATPVRTPKSPEYVKSIEDRAQKMATKDPEFNPSTDAAKIVKFDEVASVTPKEQLIRWSTGAEKNTPEGLPATTIRGLVEEDMLANPSKYTPDEIFRVSTSAVNSEAGALLQGVKVKRGGIIDNSMDFIRQEQTKLQEKIRAERLITKEAIKRFVDELPVCTI